ncbi:CapA family protein, partial [Flavobacteriaceae bacterium]|nr:CapA family protein [Flavobacteriaceae bacterium]
MEVLIAGDLVPINSNESVFLDGNLKDHFSDFEETFKSADLFIANLECPLTHHEIKINKSGTSI